MGWESHLVHLLLASKYHATAIMRKPIVLARHALRVETSKGTPNPVSLHGCDHAHQLVTSVRQTNIIASRCGRGMH